MEAGSKCQSSPSSSNRDAQTSLQFSFPSTPQKLSGRWPQADTSGESPAKRDLFSSYGATRDAPSMPAPSMSGNDVVRLNVGGEAFETCLDTLTKFEDSYFAAKFRRWQHGAQEVIFIDRDGHLFRFVLNYLRTGLMPLEDKAGILALIGEADYYNLPALGEACSAKLAALAAKEQELQVMLAAKEEERQKLFQQELRRQIQSLIPASRGHDFGPMMIDGSPQEGGHMLAQGRSADLEQVFRMDDDF